MEQRCKEKARRKNIFDEASRLSKFLYIWGGKFMLEGNRRDLTEEDVCEPMRIHKASHCSKALKKAWDEEVERCRRTNKTPQLYRAILRAYSSKYAFVCLWTLIQEISPFMQMYYLYGLLQYFAKPSDDPQAYKNAVNDALGVFVCAFVRSYLMQSCQLRAIFLGISARLAASTLLYQKVLRLRKANKNDISTGRIINLFAIDGKKIEGLYFFLAYIVVCPLQIVAASIVAWYYIGWPAIVGSVFSLACYPLQLWIGKSCSEARREVLKKSDVRVRIMNEIISGIKVLKMYAWEDSFAEMIHAARRNELKCLRKSIRIRNLGLMSIMYRSRTALFLIILFCVLFKGGVDAISVYMTFAILNIYQTVLSLSMTKGRVLTGEALISLKRMSDFLLSHEQGPGENLVKNEVNPGAKEEERKNSHSCCTENGDRSNIVISIKSMSAGWSQESGTSALSDINLDFSRGELTAVVGAVGAGKSSLLYAILGEMAVTKGCLHVSGSVSYAAQEPWVFQGSVRDNITFGQKYDPERYNKVISACALEKDLAMFPNGDRTIVGERGTLLSGGQKARVGLARAVYRKADAYLLDDPLSAVDVSVGEQIFQECVRGFLKENTVILVTHQIQILESVERIVCLENGSMKNIGPYSELQGTIANNNSPEEDHGEKNGEYTEKEIGPETDDVHDVKPSMQSEHKMFDRVKSKFMVYLKNGGTWWAFTLMCFLYFLMQFFGSFFDLWLVHWVKWEDHVHHTETALSINYYRIHNDTDSPKMSLSPHMDMATETCLIVMGASLLFLITAMIAAVFYATHFFTQASMNLHNKMFNAVLRTSVNFFNNNTSGRILNRFSHEIQIIDELLSEMLIEILAMVMYLIGNFIVVVVLNPFITIIIVICFLGMLFLKRIYIRTSTQLKKLESNARSPVIAHINQTLNGLTTIRAFSAQVRSTSEFYDYQDHNAGAQFLFLGVSFTFGCWIELLTMVYVGAVIVSLFVLENAGMTAGNAGVMMTQVLAFTTLIQYVFKTVVEFQNLLTSVERVTEYANLPSEANWEENDGPERCVESTWPDHGQIQFSDVSFRYEEKGPHTLENLNFTIMAREKIGIVGRTGAGKSSLISALLRMAVIEGSIKIDDVDTSTVPLQTLRSRISIIPQDPTLFSGSLRKNIDPFGQYSDDVLWTALEEVELKDVVSNLPNGLETNISEGGGNLSVGQKQLVCLARAIIRNNKILVLDEATANVDHEWEAVIITTRPLKPIALTSLTVGVHLTDVLIQRTIRRKFSDNTVLTIAHRLNTVMDSDKVLVLSNGNVVEFDHPHELLQNEIGHLRKMVAKCGKTTEKLLQATAKENFKRKTN